MMSNAETICMRGNRWWVERRQDARGFRLSLFSFCIGAAAAGILGVALGYYRMATTAPQFTVSVSEPRAIGGVEPGGKLALHHGVTGECGEAGGMIIAEERPINSTVWRYVKDIKMLPENLEAGGPLGVWRMSKTIKTTPPVHVGRITIWCYGAKKPLQSTFRFNVLGKLRG